MLIAREKEMKQLRELSISKKFEFLVMYGRRRVGKTEILKTFSQEKKAIYYSAQEKNNLLNIQDFSKVLQLYFEGKSLSTFENWENIFDYICEKAENRKSKTIVIIDEFPYIANEYPTIKSILQHAIDHKLKNKNVLLILCGSSISSMEEGVLSKKSPLYGRSTSLLEVEPLNYIDSFKFMGGMSLEEKMISYGILGGIPYYLNEFDYNKSIVKNIENKILKDSSVLKNEPQTLLRMELREPAIYNSILEALGSNKNKLNEIALMIHEDSFKCAKYINILKKLKIVNKILPCTEKENSKKSLYEIVDNFFCFWFKYLFKNKTYYELLGENGAARDIYSDISNYMGRIFEKISLEYMIILAKNRKLPFTPAYYGKWWGTNAVTKKQDDIDILMVSKDKKEGIFCECKFRNERFDLNEYKNLLISSENFKGVKKKYYYLISKSGFSKDVLKLKDKNVRLISLKEMIKP